MIILLLFQHFKIRERNSQIIERPGLAGFDDRIIRTKNILQVVINKDMADRVSELIVSIELSEKEIPSTISPSTAASKRKGWTRTYGYHNLLVHMQEYPMGVAVLRRHWVIDVPVPEDKEPHCQTHLTVVSIA